MSNIKFVLLHLGEQVQESHSRKISNIQNTLSDTSTLNDNIIKEIAGNVYDKKRKTELDDNRVQRKVIKMV